MMTNIELYDLERAAERAVKEKERREPIRGFEVFEASELEEAGITPEVVLAVVRELRECRERLEEYKTGR